MRILLIEPPSLTPMGNLRVLGSSGTLKTDMCWPPLDLMIIDGCLEKNGIASSIFDANATQASFEDLRRLISLKSPHMVVFSTSTCTINNDLRVAEIAKEVSRDILTVAFGTHLMALPEETIKRCPDLDVAIYNEPELVVLDLANAEGDPSQVLGIYYRKGEEILRNAPHEPCKNRDELGFPSHDKVPVHFYHDPNTRRHPISMTLAQQGCINYCKYCICPHFYGRLNKRSVDHVIQEFQWVEDLGIKEMRFFDSGVTHDPQWANELFDKMINTKLDVTWVGNARADKISYELARKMKEAGCHTVCIGCESGDPEILKNVAKNETPERIAQAVQDAKKAGLDVLVYFILGLPGETRESMERTIRFAKKLDPKIITLNIAVPLPGTKFYRYIEENNYFVTRDWSRFDPVGKPVFSYPNLSGDEIYHMMKIGYRSFYLRPSYLLRRVLELRTTFDIKNALINFSGFVKRYGVAN